MRDQTRRRWLVEQWRTSWGQQTEVPLKHPPKENQQAHPFEIRKMPRHVLTVDQLQFDQEHATLALTAEQPVVAVDAN